MWQSGDTSIIHKGGIWRDISSVKKQFLCGGGAKAKSGGKYGLV